ncbi:hypothetical protein P5P86_15325 [Nocardioides sp. BP30]|uniref:hypothetical protein n=1 Tax=Nocardioides sp. BP30 TaxID=3036374 RepID=UPI0024685FF0|nr:hypothetical protein [Nocardioides sp. BP30]WGL51325.1 hypothetical protein P5P86_15325 [Nocardioides sp. BP30]
MSEYADDANPADVDEQSIPLGDGEPDAVEDAPTPHDEVDDADLLEQSTPVGGEDEDYPNDLEVEPDV